MFDVVEAVNKIVSPVFLVGGAVRDHLRGVPPKENQDYDFVTPLVPDEVEARIVAAGRRCYDLGKRFGTLGFKAPLDDGRFVMVEITTYRQEAYELDSRKPVVQFVETLSEDLARRDFTINAIAMDHRGMIIDPFDGRSDITAKRIQAVGSASERFKDDPLRMLRAFRFQATLNYFIARGTYQAIEEQADTIVHVSRERWVTELDKILSADAPSHSIGAMFNLGIMQWMVPELGEKWQVNSYVRMRTATTLEEKWALLLCSVDLMQVGRRHEKFRHISLERIYEHLKFSNDRRKRVTEFVDKIVKDTG